jgi:hypothetical protein
MKKGYFYIICSSLDKVELSAQLLKLSKDKSRIKILTNEEFKRNQKNKAA